jgi:hypothetical protein
VSDRQNEVLNAIDATLSGYTDSDPVSSDAMRWSPREDEEQTIEVEGGAKVTFFSNGYSILDEHLYVEATGHLYPHPPRRPVDQFSLTRAASSDSIPALLSNPAEGNEEPNPAGPDLAATTADWVHAVLGGEADRLHPWQMRMLSDVISAGPGRLELETRGRNVMGPRGFIRSGDSDSIPVHISPGEAMIPGPNGLIHIRGAYGDEPMQVTEVDLDDIEGERT